MNRRNLLLLPAALLALAAARPAPAVPAVLVADHAAAFVISHSPAAGPSSARPRPAPERRLARKLTQWLTSSLLPETDGTSLDSRRAQRRLGSLVKRAGGLLQQALDRQIAGGRTRGPAPQGSLSALTTAALITVPGLTLDETLTVETQVGSQPYSVTLDRTQSASVESGLKLRMDYNTPVDPRTTGGVSVFTALIRSTDAPTVGVLIVAILDPALSALLETFGAGNETTTAEAVTLSLTYKVTGSALGERSTDPQDAGVAYYSVQDLYGAGVPPELAAELQALLASL